MDKIERSDRLKRIEENLQSLYSSASTLLKEKAKLEKQALEELFAPLKSVECIVCGEPFLPGPKSKGPYCSIKCGHTYRKRVCRKKQARDEFNVNSSEYKELDKELRLLNQKRQVKHD